MSLSFPNSGDMVNVGSASMLDNMSVGTYLVWCFPASITTDCRMLQKGLAASGINLFTIDGVTSSGALLLDIKRATTNLIMRKNGLVTLNSWQFLGCSYDASKADSDQHLYRGTLNASATEVTAYDAQQVGSGTVGDNSATDQGIGNRLPAGGYQFSGKIGFVGIWNRQLSLQELLDQQFRPHVTNGCILFMYLGFNGIGTQPDLSGNLNNGTVTGAAISTYIPLGPPFGFNLGIPYSIPVGITLDQKSFRFRLDDGGEASATWDGNQEANLTKEAGNERLRFIVNASGDPAADAYQLEWSKVGEDVWRKVEN